MPRTCWWAILFLSKVKLLVLGPAGHATTTVSRVSHGHNTDQAIMLLGLISAQLDHVTDAVVNEKAVHWLCREQDRCPQASQMKGVSDTGKACRHLHSG
jgi:hypothetical protein